MSRSVWFALFALACLLFGVPIYLVTETSWPPWAHVIGAMLGCAPGTALMIWLSRRRPAR